MTLAENIKAALHGGVPGGKWKEGLLFEGIRHYDKTSKETQLSDLYRFIV